MPKFQAQVKVDLPVGSTFSDVEIEARHQQEAYALLETKYGVNRNTGIRLLREKRDEEAKSNAIERKARAARQKSRNSEVYSAAEALGKAAGESLKERGAFGITVIAILFIIALIILSLIL